MSDDRFELKISADEHESFIARLEAIGAEFVIAPNDWITVRIDDSPYFHGLEIVHWKGGMSVWLPGAATVYDKNGNEMHRLP